MATTARGEGNEGRMTSGDTNSSRASSGRIRIRLLAFALLLVGVSLTALRRGLRRNTPVACSTARPAPCAVAALHRPATARSGITRRPIRSTPTSVFRRSRVRPTNAGSSSSTTSCTPANGVQRRCRAPHLVRQRLVERGSTRTARTCSSGRENRQAEPRRVRPLRRSVCRSNTNSRHRCCSTR